MKVFFSLCVAFLNTSGAVCCPNHSMLAIKAFSDILQNEKTFLFNAVKNK